MEFQEALTTRRSIRGFLDEPIPAEELRAIFEDAQRAPSWCNIQPWRVWVTSGEETTRLTNALLHAADHMGAKAGASTVETDFPWPPGYPGEYGEKRKACGIALYGAMGIRREDGAKRAAAWRNNFAAFGAPHIAMVGVDPHFGMYGSLDVGCWIQSLLLSVHARGYGACAQASLALFPEAVRSVIDIPSEIGLLCGIAIGKVDPDAPANQCWTARDLEGSVRFLG